MPPVLKRREALAAKLPTYFTGKPCPKGHVAERTASNGSCVVCGRDRSRLYGQENKPARSEKFRRWSEKHAEQRRADVQAWRASNPEKVKASHKAWRKANPEKDRSYRKHRGQPLIEDLSPGLIDKLLSQQGGKCACPCRQPLMSYHVDHILAIAKGGLHADENIQLLTPRCNLLKSTKDNAAFMAEQEKKYANT